MDCFVVPPNGTSRNDKLCDFHSLALFAMNCLTTRFRRVAAVLRVMCYVWRGVGDKPRPTARPAVAPYLGAEPTCCGQHVPPWEICQRGTGLLVSIESRVIG